VTVRQRPFGSTGLVVSEVGMGCSRLGGVLSGDARDEADLLRAAIDSGITFFDTSDLYSHGQSEVAVGTAIRSRRAEVVVATKGGYVPRGQAFLEWVKPLVRPVVRALRVRRPRGSTLGAGGGGPIPQDFTPAHLRAAVDASLARLGTDYIDIYQLHSPSTAVIDAGEYVGVLDELKAAGKIRHYGIAADHAGDVATFDRHPSVGSLQVPFSVIDQTAAEDLLPRASASGVGVISRSCFAAGLLVKPMPESELREQTPDWKRVAEFQAKAAELGREPRALALQFSLAAPFSVTIVGMHKREHLTEILRDVEAPPLTAAEAASLVQFARP
jgi:aryl-alcohol dehydrogenase-like predicted oxidoreductase